MLQQSEKRVVSLAAALIGQKKLVSPPFFMV